MYIYVCMYGVRFFGYLAIRTLQNYQVRGATIISWAATPSGPHHGSTTATRLHRSGVPSAAGTESTSPKPDARARFGVRRLGVPKGRVCSRPRS